MSNSEIDKLIDRIPKENKYVVTTEEVVNYIYMLENRINETLEFINEYCKYNKITINGNKYYDEYILNNVIDILRGEEK